MFDLNSFDFKTVIVSVRIYSPFISQKNAHFKVKLLQEIYLLGNQYLSDLKDQIKCNLDRMNLKDVSDNCFLKNLESKSLTKVCQNFNSKIILICFLLTYQII